MYSSIANQRSTLGATGLRMSLDGLDQTDARTTMPQSTQGLVSGLCAERFRIVCNQVVFIPKTVKVIIQENKLLIVGLVQVQDESGESVTKVFRKAYELPQMVLPNKFTTLFTVHGHLVVEFPIILSSLDGLTGRAHVDSGVDATIKGGFGKNTDDFAPLNRNVYKEMDILQGGKHLPLVDMPIKLATVSHGFPNELSYKREISPTDDSLPLNYDAYTAMGSSQTDDFLPAKYWKTKQSGTSGFSRGADWNESPQWGSMRGMGYNSIGY